MIWPAIQSALRRAPFQHITSIVFLLVTAVLLAGGLGEVVRGARISVFIPVGATAALVGWGLGTRRFNGWLAWGGIIFLGIALLWVSTAQLGGPLYQLVGALAKVVDQVFLSVWNQKNQKIVPDFLPVTTAWLALVTQSAGLWQRIMLWLPSIQNGQNRFDPVIYVMAWSFLLWLAIAWEGWFVRRGLVLSATVPSLVLLAEVVYLTGIDATPLLILLWITLLLTGLTHFRVTFASWMKRGVDYAEIILDTTITLIFTVTFGLIVMAWLLPSVSIQQIVDTVRENSIQTKSSASLADTLGLEMVSEKVTASAAGKVQPLMAESHFIGPGPRLSQDLVMTIRTNEIPPILPNQVVDPAKPVPYHRWRNNTLDRYIGTGWANTPVDKLSYDAKTPIFAQIPVKYNSMLQIVHVANNSRGSLFWDGVLYSVDQPFEVVWRTKPETDSATNDRAFTNADMFAVSSPAKDYQVISLIIDADAEQLRAASGIYPETIRKRYLLLPDTVPERVLALAREITATAPTPYDQAVALESYLRKTYPYSLDVPAPPAGRDVVDYFLFDLKKGFCDYYATSMVVMARAVGLPARIVFGYASGTYDPVAAEYHIVAADAHAWVEVYFPQVGWVEFDPTASQPEIDRQTKPVKPANQQAAASGNSQSNGLMGLLMRSSALDLMGWGVLAAAALAALLFVVQTGEFWLLTNLPTTRAMRIIYRSLYRIGRRVAGPTTAGETAEEFAALLRARLQHIAQKNWLYDSFAPAVSELNLLAALYERAVYTPRPPEQTEIRTALRAWQTLRLRLLLANLIPDKIVNRKS